MVFEKKNKAWNKGLKLPPTSEKHKAIISKANKGKIVKAKTERYRDKTQWIIIEGVIEPIISKELFFKAQKKKQERISNKSMTVGTTSEIVSDTQYNAQRTVLFISNTSAAGQKVSILIGEEAVIGKGITIGSGGFYQDSKGENYNPSNEQVNIISDAAGATISVHERVIMRGV